MTTTNPCSWVCLCGRLFVRYWLLVRRWGCTSGSIPSWVCMLGAAPFAALGFVSYHGMPAEKFLWVWFRSEILEPKVIRFQPTNLYYEIMKDTIAQHEKEARKQHESD